MKRVIEKKLYNTATAEKIAEWNNGRGRADFNGIEETLYRTKKGAFFLKYWGGAATSYAEILGSHSSEGSGIKPLSNQESLEWLENTGNDEIALNLFPDEIEEA